jgi:hypothetical protein
LLVLPAADLSHSGSSNRFTMHEPEHTSITIAPNETAENVLARISGYNRKQKLPIKKIKDFWKRFVVEAHGLIPVYMFSKPTGIFGISDNQFGVFSDIYHENNIRSIVVDRVNNCGDPSVAAEITYFHYGEREPWDKTCRFLKPRSLSLVNNGKCHLYRGTVVVATFTLETLVYAEDVCAQDLSIWLPEQSSIVNSTLPFYDMFDVICKYASNCSLCRLRDFVCVNDAGVWRKLMTCKDFFVHLGISPPYRALVVLFRTKDDTTFPKLRYM